MPRYPVRPGVPTENGWPMVNANRTVSVQVVPAARKVPLLRGDVATILNAFLILYNRRVEPITSQVWGWSPDNDVWNSNHMSGTAIDINAPKYPWGTYRMPAATIAKVNALLKDFEGVVFWGRNWGKPDEMHYQIGLPPNNPRVAALARKLNNGHLGAYGTSTPPKPQPQPQPKGNPMSEQKINEIHDTVTGHYKSRYDLEEVKAGKRDASKVYQDRPIGYLLNIDKHTYDVWANRLPAIESKLDKILEKLDK